MKWLRRLVVGLQKADPQKNENAAEGESCKMSQEDQLGGNFFLPTIDYALCCLMDRFEQMGTVAAIFDFLCNHENLLREYEHDCFPAACQNFCKTMGGIDPLEINDELERYVFIVRKNKNFLTDIYQRQLLKTHPNLCIALQDVLTCPAVLVASTKRSFSMLKPIKIFHKSTMMD